MPSLLLHRRRRSGDRGERAVTLAPSPEGESEGLHAGIEKLDFEGAVGDRTVLPDELIEALLVDHALAVGIDVRAVIGAGRHAVDRHSETDRLVVGRRTEKEMQNAG